MSDHGDHGGGGLPLLATIEHYLHTSHDRGFHAAATPFIVAYFVLLALFFVISPAQSLANFALLIFLSPLWLPIMLVRFAWRRFLGAQRMNFLARQKNILLELRLPRDTMKTPVAMDAIFATLHIGPGEATWYKKLILGGTRPWFSYELVSTGGRVHFYIWTRDAMRRAIESAIYAQYPNAELVEVPDYSREYDPAAHGNTVTGFDYVLGQPDPFPLKTYIDYGLDRPAKPEEQVDPLAQIIELFGSIGPNEHMWLQFVARINRNEKYRGKKNPDGSDYKFADALKEEREKIRSAAVRKVKGTDALGNATENEVYSPPTEGEKDKIKAMETKASKQLFEVGVRALYSAPEEYAQGIMGAFLVSLFKPFNTENMNSLGVSGAFSNKFSNYPWEDPGGHHEHHELERLVDVYRRRSFFFDPYRGDTNILNTEELATMFHVPSSTVATPGLPRIGSTTGGAPVNLPT